MGEKDRLDRRRDGSDRERRWSVGNVNRCRSQVMQNLADLATVFVVGELRCGGRVFEDRRWKTPGEGQIVVVPTKQDGLEQNGEEAEPCTALAYAESPLNHARRHSVQRPLRTRWWS